MSHPSVASPRETSIDFPTATFDYPLPEDRIAQTPLPERDRARLLHLTPEGDCEDRIVADLPDLLRPGDVLVVNDTRVRQARLRGRRQGGGGAEIFVLERLAEDRFLCLVRPARRLSAGSVVELAEGRLRAVVGEPAPGHPGARVVTIHGATNDVEAEIERVGDVPLPPYIRAPLADPARYQTVFAASPPESAAAPTAGLHFTPALVRRLVERGIEITSVRLAVGLGTFVPITTETVAAHRLHRERFTLSDAAAEAIAAGRARGGRIVAVGTTVLRVLETCALDGGLVEPRAGTTDLYIRPGVPVRVADGLLTNFHQPRSSLLVLLAGVVGVDRWRRAYDHALAAGYRFLSFGDCMLCWTRWPQR